MTTIGGQVCKYWVAMIVGVCVSSGLSTSFSPFCLAQDQLSSILILRTPVKRQIIGEDIHTFVVKLESKQYVGIEIGYFGDNLGITIYEPAGQQIKQIRCQNHNSIPISLIAKSAGEYRIAIRANEKRKLPTVYQIEMKEMRKPTKGDDLRIQAEKAFFEGERLRWMQKVDEARMAIKKFDEAKRYWHLTGDKQEETIALRNTGELYELLGETQKALFYYSQSLALSKKIRDQNAETDALNRIGYIYVYSGEKQKAEEILSRAFSLSQANQYRQGQAQSLNNLGEYNYFSGNYSKSIELYHQCLLIYQEINHPRGEALALLNLCEVHSTIADKEEAIKLYNQSLTLWRVIEDVRGEALAELAGAGINAKWGNKQDAISLYSESLKKMKRVGDKLWEAANYNGLGYIYGKIGEPDKAIEHRLQALKLVRNLRLSVVSTTTLFEIGRLYQSLGESKKALRCFYEIQQSNNILTPSLLAPWLLHDTGMALASLGKEAKRWNITKKRLHSILHSAFVELSSVALVIGIIRAGKNKKHSKVFKKHSKSIRK